MISGPHKLVVGDDITIRSTYLAHPHRLTVKKVYEDDIITAAMLEFEAMAQEYDKLKKIALALDASPEPIEREDCLCTLCGRFPQELGRPDEHDPSCPWRMVKEFINGKEQPTP